MLSTGTGGWARWECEIPASGAPGAIDRQPLVLTGERGARTGDKSFPAQQTHPHSRANTHAPTHTKRWADPTSRAYRLFLSLSFIYSI